MNIKEWIPTGILISIKGERTAGADGNVASSADVWSCTTDWAW